MFEGPRGHFSLIGEVVEDLTSIFAIATMFYSSENTVKKIHIEGQSYNFSQLVKEVSITHSMVPGCPFLPPSPFSFLLDRVVQRFTSSVLTNAKPGEQVWSSVYQECGV